MFFDVILGSLWLLNSSAPIVFGQVCADKNSNNNVNLVRLVLRRRLVLGAAGGVGLAAVHIGKVCGAVVIAMVRGNEKVEISRAEYVVAEGEHQWSSSSSNNNQPSMSSSSSSSSSNSSVVSMIVSMGFSYLQVMEAYSLFGDDADYIVCYLLETTATRRKGKAAKS